MKILFVFLLFIFAGCAGTTTTAINSEPSGARISIDGDFRGTTPCAVDLEGWGFGGDSRKIEISFDEKTKKTVLVNKRHFIGNGVWISYWPDFLNIKRGD